MAQSPPPINSPIRIVPQLITRTEDTRNPPPIPRTPKVWMLFGTAIRKMLQSSPAMKKKKSAGIKRKDENRKEEKRKESKLVKISMGLQKRQNCQSKNCRRSRRREYLVFFLVKGSEETIKQFERRSRESTEGFFPFAFRKTMSMAVDSEKLQNASTAVWV
ncbi:hypothetical protein CEXT_656091 [Caerostris extrusa]|uniref:Uncharacterized protein n=1 Tax=Caerostris extrusa TaxID=172846 RepID=A0AAV4X006_CAEEX|nr:hypothetical protein CEXT_656091 [Caerostris extrusa]